MIKNIIFDMGNVLMDYNPQVPLDLYCKTEEEKEVIRRELFGGSEWVQGDLGNITEEELYEKVRNRIPQKWHDSLRKCVYQWDVCMVPLPEALKFYQYAKQKGYHMYVLSNASRKFYEYFPRFAPLKEFDGIVVSADLHMIKPDIRIYKYLLEKYELKPEECLFIDDRADNVAAAKQAGMQGQVYEGEFENIKKFYQL